MTNINLAMLTNATDEELVKICTFNKPESEFEPVDYLIVELIKRLEASKEHATEYDNLLSDLKELKEDLTDIRTQVEKTDDLFKDLIEDYNQD